jgi:hypothetical protein
MVDDLSNANLWEFFFGNFFFVFLVLWFSEGLSEITERGECYRQTLCIDFKLRSKIQDTIVMQEIP